MPINLNVTGKTTSFPQPTFSNADGVIQAMVSGDKAAASAGLALVIGSAAPRNVHDFVHSFNESNQDKLLESFYDPSVPATTSAPNGPTLKQSGKSIADLIKLLEGDSDAAKKIRLYLATNGAVESKFEAQTLDVNPNHGLNLLLANPMVAAVVMEQRKRQSELAYARVAQPANMFGAPFPFNGPSVSVQLMRGGQQSDLNPDFPIEMRGAGYAIAQMRGGQLPLMLGTVASPTSWRPVSDGSFISASLKAALASLEQSLSSKGATLADATKTQVSALIQQLEDAEKAVKNSRNELNTFNNAIASGNANVKDQKNIDASTITRTVEAYNMAMKSRQKLENKLFRVVIALGGKVQVV
jgi:hypothetical protein